MGTVTDDLQGFVHDELIYLWGQLIDAYRSYLDGSWLGVPNKPWNEGGTWSGRCEGLGERIKAATRLDGPVSWRDIPMPVLADGWFAWANERLEIEDPDLPDDEGVARCREYVAGQMRSAECR
jgi:hypothetical protein